MTLPASKLSVFLLFNNTSPPLLYTLSLHDALPISSSGFEEPDTETIEWISVVRWRRVSGSSRYTAPAHRSEEHTSELQSRFDLVCRLLLEKKNKHRHTGKP